MMFLYKFLFLFFVMTGTLVATTATSWFTAWIGLEINLLSLMPLMKMFNNCYTSEASIKYLIIQSFSSMVFLFSSTLYAYTKMILSMNYTLSLFVNSALLLKLGAAPFHFWLPEVLSGTSWQMNFILLTWQKLAPMGILPLTSYTPEFLTIFIIFSAMIGSLQGLNQNCMKKIMAYSSISHTSWLISALLDSVTIWFYYMLIYSFLNFNIMIVLEKYNIYNLLQMNKLFSSNKKIKYFFMMNFVSMGGLPPFLGFLPKWMTINYLINNKYWLITIMLTMLTLISLYFYLRITFSSLSLNTEESLMNIFNYYSFFHFMTNFMSLTGLLFFMFMNYFL